MTGRNVSSRALLPAAVAACALLLSSCSPSSNTTAAKSDDKAQAAAGAKVEILKEDGTPDYLAMAEAVKRPDGTYDLSRLDSKYFILPHSEKDYADLAKLPDWSGMWAMNEAMQNAETENS